MEGKRVHANVGSIENGGFAERVVIELDFESAKDLYLTLQNCLGAFAHTTDLYIDHIPIAESEATDTVQKYINEDCCNDLRHILKRIEAVFPSLKGFNNDS